MREIKFRAFVKNHTRMIYSDEFVNGDLSLFFSLVETMRRQGADIVIEQFIGRTDKNGKEIYEGDILELTEDCPNHLYYKGRIFQCKYIIAQDTIPGLFFMSGGLIDINIARKTEKYVIIGNIHENPELLESDNA